MPAVYDRCVRKVKTKGHSTRSAHAICTSAKAGKTGRTKPKPKPKRGPSAFLNAQKQAVKA